MFFIIKKKKEKIPNQHSAGYKQLEAKIRIGLERAEKLKTIKDFDIEFPSIPTHDELINLNKFIINNEEESGAFLSSSSFSKPCDESSFSKEEISVLRHGSTINGRDYVPFFSEIDTKNEKFHNFQIPFTDKDGKLALSKSQRDRFSEWVRPGDLYETPSMLATGSLSSFSVKQTCISDCSFVSSLTVIAQYERKFNKNLLSKFDFLFNIFCKIKFKKILKLESSIRKTRRVNQFIIRVANIWYLLN